MRSGSTLARVFEEILGEAERNPSFAKRINAALGVRADGKAENTRSGAAKGRSRRLPGAFDPFDVCKTSGIEVLRQRLVALDTEQLKDIVSEHAMDGTRLALKWKVPQRLIELIIKTVVDRSSKGDAFREIPIGPKGRQTMATLGDQKACVLNCGGTATVRLVRPPDAHFVADGAQLPDRPEPTLMWVCDTCEFEQHVDHVS